MQAESINGLKNVYGLQLALHLPEGSEIRRQIFDKLDTGDLKDKARWTAVMNYSRVPNNRPPLIVNSSIFFHPGHLYSNHSHPLFLMFSHFCTHF